MTTKVPAALCGSDVGADKVALTGDQTVAGVKTFSSQPVLPQAPVQRTAVASTSGTSIDFTSIPSWVKRITVLFQGVSTSGTSDVMVRLGTSGGFVATGYLGSVGTSASFSNISTGFGMFGATAPAASTVFHGQMTLINVTGNVWVASSLIGFSDTAGTRFSAGSLSLAAALTQIRITTAGGTDTFDAGQVNVFYE